MVLKFTGLDIVKLTFVVSVKYLIIIDHNMTESLISFGHVMN